MKHWQKKSRPSFVAILQVLYKYTTNACKIEYVGYAGVGG